MEFTYKAYRYLVNLTINNGYKISDYDSVDKYNKSIIFRHDVDFCPRKALKIAKIEHEIGIRSTFFVFVSTGFYNIFSIESNEIFEKILNMGHQIGLHYDEQKYLTTSIDQIKEHIYSEAEILSRALSTQIKVVSMHRPSKLTLESSIELDGLINSYGKKYFGEIKYVSDSRMNWRENPIELIKNHEYNKIQILTHPFWYSEEVESIQNKFKKFLNEAVVSKYDLLNNNFRDLGEYIERREYYD